MLHVDGASAVPNCSFRAQPTKKTNIHIIATTQMNILNMKVGKVRNLVIKDIKQETINKNIDGIPTELEKIVFEAEDTYTHKIFFISDAWVKTIDSVAIKGLWLALQNDGKEIQKNSTLAKLLEYYKTDTLQEFIGKTVEVYPDAKNFLVLVACILTETI